MAAPLLLSVIVPTFNEALNIDRLVTQLAQLLDEAFGQRYEIIVVDDNSPDRTWELAQKLVASAPDFASCAVNRSAACRRPSSAAGKRPAARCCA